MCVFVFVSNVNSRLPIVIHLCIQNYVQDIHAFVTFETAHLQSCPVARVICNETRNIVVQVYPLIACPAVCDSIWSSVTIFPSDDFKFQVKLHEFDTFHLFYIFYLFCNQKVWFHIIFTLYLWNVCNFFPFGRFYSICITEFQFSALIKKLP